jgi:DUF1680 family protein
MLPGISLGGDLYFYQNPLADDGTHRREPWFDCACCPPNLARTLASIGGYLATTSDEGVWLHLYARSEIDLALPGGPDVRLSADTDYPWDGNVRVEVNGEGLFSLNLRIPGWIAEGAAIRVNGDMQSKPCTPGSYIEIRRTWQPGDVVEIDLPMVARQVKAHPYLFENAGRVAVMRGPLLYCLEQADNPGIDPRDVIVGPASAFKAEQVDGQLGRTTVLRATASISPPSGHWNGQLYAAAEDDESAGVAPADITLIPYFLWANREPGRMEVWLRRDG